MSVCAILLAAGAATRMRGADKLTEPVRGNPLLRDRAEMLLASDVAQIVVVLPEAHAAREQALVGLDVIIARNPIAESGMASSIQSGIRALPRSCDGALIMPADLPDLTTADIDLMVSAFVTSPALIHRATTPSGKAGSPVLFPRTYFAELLELEGDESGRRVVARNKAQLRTHELSDQRAIRDLDTPEAWAAWRAENDPKT